MAEIKGTNVASRITPYTTEDRYPTHDEEYGRGGYRSVNTVSEMNAIPIERRKEGMLVYVVGDKTYKLTNGKFIANSSGSTIDSELSTSSVNAVQNKIITSEINGLKTSINSKQAKLVSGSTIKTINGQSILGSGNISISGGSGGGTDVYSVDTSRLSFASISNGDSITFDQEEELGVILTQWATGLIVLYFDGNQNPVYIGVLNISFEGISSKMTMSFTNDRGTYVYIANMTNNKWEIHVVHNANLDIDVKTKDNQIFFRIKEIAHNGYIQFLTRKKKTYKNLHGTTYKGNTYTVYGLSYNNPEVGLNASSLTPYVWYEYPILLDSIATSHSAGSNNQTGFPTMYDTVKFTGNTHASSIRYKPTASKRSTVLHAGLQYNVLSDEYINGNDCRKIFEHRGNMVGINARLTVLNTQTFDGRFKIVYSLQ